MAGRIRSIRPELREWAPFAALTDAAARLMCMLPTLADDAGRCPAGPSFLGGAVFFARSKSPHVIGQLLAELEQASLIRRYASEGSAYLEIVGWRDKSHPNYQYIKKPQPPRYPAPPHETAPPRRNQNLPLETTDLDQGSGIRERESRESSKPPKPPPDPLPSGASLQSASVPHDARADLRRRKWAELEAIRTEVAGMLGKQVRPLPAFDPGERELAARILEAGSRAEADVDHVLAIARAEALGKGTVQYLTGSLFGANSWRRALGMTLDDAGVERKSAQSSAPKKLRNYADNPPPKLGPEDPWESLL